MHAGESLRSASAQHLKKNCLCVVLHMVRNRNDCLPAVILLLLCFLFKRFIAQYPGGLLQPKSMAFCILRHINRVYMARYVKPLAKLRRKPRILPALGASDAVLHMHRLQRKIELICALSFYLI